MLSPRQVLNSKEITNYKIFELIIIILIIMIVCCIFAELIGGLIIISIINMDLFLEKDSNNKLL
jgi:hypothetical protein